MILSSEKKGCLTRNLSGITPAPPDQEEEKEEKSSLKRPDWLLCFFCCRGINIPVPVLAILRNKFSSALSR